MNPQKTQLQRILARLKSGKAITSLKALQLYGCSRLAAVIHRIKSRLGIRIKSKTITVETRFGKSFVSEYWIDKKVLLSL